jgi:hypothetical protein
MRHQCIFRVFLITVVMLLSWNNLGEWFTPKAHAQTIQTEFEYAVKAICSASGTFDDQVLANGIYRTVVNIHNPTDKQVIFARKQVLAVPEGSSQEDTVTLFKSITLEPNAALSINCSDISEFFNSVPRTSGVVISSLFVFIEGFLVINSPVKLDVFAVYTARHSDGEVETMQVENIRAKKVLKTINVVNGGTTGKSCGQDNNDSQCTPDEYCAKAIGDCEGTGTCMSRPEICLDIFDPVCGCDGNTYSNDCYAARAGVNVAHQGSCDLSSEK